ncbi:MAG: glycosyltransferase family 2 protein [Chloroflexota bacterium]|nr:glycosyltransferase family 2 protein [Chloroflexota bacterium]
MCQPKVSFILDASHGTDSELKNTITSIQILKGDNWEVIIIPPVNTTSLNLPHHIQSDIKVTVVQNVSNILEKVSGEYVIFSQAGDRFFNSLLIRFYQSLNEGHNADVFYFDNEVQGELSPKSTPFFKPAKLSPTLLLSLNYLSRGFIHFDALREVLAVVNPQKDLLYQEYGAMLWLYEAGASFQHLPFLLVSQTHWVTSNRKESQEVITKYLYRKGLKDVIAQSQNIGARFSWKADHPSVSIVILTKNHRTMLKSLLDSMHSYQYIQQVNITIVDNNSDDPATLAYYEEFSKNPEIQIIPYSRPFNYSEAINLGAANSDSDLILFMNDDMRVINANWLSELTQWAIRPEVGVVGAKLVRDNHTIQHAGIIMGLTGYVGHIYHNAPEHYFGLWGSVDWYRDILAVTGACQMMRREIFNQVGGYDENYQLAFGDIDFCVRVHELGYQNIYNPHAVLCHYEGQSRGYTTPVEDILRGYEKLEKYLINNDPFFSPNLTYTKIPRCNQKFQSEEERIHQFEERKKFYIKNK